MESNGNQNMPPSALCRSGCGFYASASFDGMCSKCYKDALKRKQASSSPVGGGRTSPATSTCGQATSSSSSDSNTSVSVAHATTSTQTPAMPSIETASTTVPTVSTSQSETSKDLKEECETSGGAAASPDTDDSSDSPEKDGKKPKKNRCFSCKKKVGLTGFQCRCGGLFCSLHRYSDKHDCQFNYREHGQELIKKQNPVIVGEKIQKI